MRMRHETLVMLLAAGLLGAPAQAAIVQQPGGVTSKPVCPPAQPLTMRCHSEVVTDSQGNPLTSNTTAPSTHAGKKSAKPKQKKPVR
jgi:hypothetical protein